VLLLPRDEAERRLGEAGYRVVSAAEIGGVDGGESRVVRLRRAGAAGVELVLARYRPTV
jgi:hypothetical protein